MRNDLARGELAHLLADRFQRVVESAIADHGLVLLADQFDQARAPRGGVAVRDQSFDRWRHAARRRPRRQAEIGQAHDLALAHRDAAEDLRQIFADADPDDQFFDLAERPFGLHPFGISRELPQRLDISREPGEAVRRALFAIEERRLRSCRRP